MKNYRRLSYTRARTFWLRPRLISFGRYNREFKIDSPTRAKNISHQRFSLFSLCFSLIQSNMLSPASFFIVSVQSAGCPDRYPWLLLFADARCSRPRSRGNIYVPAIHVCDNSTNGGHYRGGRSTTCTGTQNYSRLHLRDFRCTHTRARSRAQRRG